MQKLEPIEELTRAGLLRRMREIFGFDWIMASSTEEITLLKRNKQGEEVKYPYGTLFQSGLAKGVDTYRSQPMLRRGMITNLALDDKVAYKIAVMPADMEFEVTCKDARLDRLQQFAKRWLMTSQAGYLKFGVGYGKTQFNISVILNETLSFTKRDAGPDNIQEHTLVTTMLVKGYISEATLIEEQAIKEVQLDAMVGDDPQAMNSVTFSFNRKWDP